MYYTDHTVVYLDGHWKKANKAHGNLFSQSLHYGNGIFEGLRAYATPLGPKIFKPFHHFERLLYSCKSMGIQLDYTVDDLVAISYDLLERNTLKHAYIRPLVFMSPNMSLETDSRPILMMSAWKWKPYLGNNLLKVITSSYERPNPRSCIIGAKVTGHLINSTLAINEAKAKGYDEALLNDLNGFVAQGSSSNFFFEKNDELFTAPSGNVMPGITRQTIIDLAKEMHIPVNERFFTTEDVEGADSAFFTGTATEVIGLESLNDIPFTKNWEETIGYRLLQAYTGLVANADRHIIDIV